MTWCTYHRNETLVHQQLTLHQLHHCHPSQWLRKRFFRLRDVTFNIDTTYKIIACIERAIVLWVNWASVSEPHTSELAGEFSICKYGTYVIPYISMIYLSGALPQVWAR